MSCCSSLTRTRGTHLQHAAEEFRSEHAHMVDTKVGWGVASSAGAVAGWLSVEGVRGRALGVRGAARRSAISRFSAAIVACSSGTVLRSAHDICCVAEGRSDIHCLSARTRQRRRQMAGSLGNGMLVTQSSMSGLRCEHLTLESLPSVRFTANCCSFPHTGGLAKASLDASSCS